MGKVTDYIRTKYFKNNCSVNRLQFTALNIMVLLIRYGFLKYFPRFHFTTQQLLHLCISFKWLSSGYTYDVSFWNRFSAIDYSRALELRYASNLISVYVTGFEQSHL